MNVASTYALVLNVCLVTIFLTTLMLCPDAYVDDLVVWMGAKEGIMGLLMIISIVMMIGAIPAFVFFHFGNAIEFLLSIILGGVALFVGLGAQISAMMLQNQFLSRRLLAVEEELEKELEKDSVGKFTD